MRKENKVRLTATATFALLFWLSTYISAFLTTFFPSHAGVIILGWTIVNMIWFVRLYKILKDPITVLEKKEKEPKEMIV